MEEVAKNNNIFFVGSDYCYTSRKPIPKRYFFTPSSYACAVTHFGDLIHLHDHTIRDKPSYRPRLMEKIHF